MAERRAESPPDVVTPAPASTAALLPRARGGDREALDRLFASAAGRLALYVRLRLGPRLREQVDEADVLQETFLEAQRALAAFEPPGDPARAGDAFGRWICRIAENRVRGLADHHGAQKRRPPGERARLSRVLELARASRTGPATAAAREEERERLGAAIETLPEDQREVLLARFFEDRTVDEIAARTGHGATTVRRMLGRATARLGELLE